MKPVVSTDLKFILGTFFGCINPGAEFELKSVQKHDYELSIKFFIKDNAVVRLNFVAPKTSIYTEPGGLQTNGDRMKHQLKAVKYMLKTYPQYVKVNPTRKSKFPEIRLVNKNTTRKRS